MPQFILQSSGTVNVVMPVSFTDLDEFTRGYIEAMFFTSECPQVSKREFMTKRHQKAMRDGTADGSIPCDVGFADIAPESLRQIIADCNTFQQANADDLTEACDNGRINGYDMQHAGNDFWYTRNGHGVGFWDRGLGDIGDKLSKACRRTELHVHFYRGKVWCE